MSSAIVRSTLRTAVRGGARFNPASSRSSSAGREVSKWEKITYVGIVACLILAVVNLSKGHPLRTSCVSILAHSEQGVSMGT